MSKFHHKSDKLGKADKLAKADKLEKQLWLDKMERQEKMEYQERMERQKVERSHEKVRYRMMNPLEAHMLSKISAGVDTMLLNGKHKEYLMDTEVREGGREGGGGGGGGKGEARGRLEKKKARVSCRKRKRSAIVEM